jgi:hypothetical protein
LHMSMKKKQLTCASGMTGLDHARTNALLSM